jgi:ABC-2 type transport system permease protein
MIGDLRAVRVLWRRELLSFLHSPLRIVLGLATPLLFFLVLGTGLDSALGADADRLSDFRAYMFAGAVLMAIQAPALTAGASIVWESRNGFLRQAFVAPVRRESLLLGICLGGATTGAGYGALMLLLAPTTGVPYTPELLLALLVVALIGFGFTTLGVLVAVYLTRPESFQVVISLCMMPLLFLSGAMFPARGLPGWLGTAVLVNPLTYGVDALRRTLPGDARLSGQATGPQWAGWTPPVALEIAGLATLALLALVVAARRFARAE